MRQGWARTVNKRKHAGGECLSANKNRFTFVSDLVASIHSSVHCRRKLYTKNVLAVERYTTIARNLFRNDDDQKCDVFLV